MAWQIARRGGGAGVRILSLFLMLIILLICRSVYPHRLVAALNMCLYMCLFVGEGRLRVNYVLENIRIANVECKHKKTFEP